jgi:phosphate transport system substrate-binding protein
MKKCSCWLLAALLLVLPTASAWAGTLTIKGSDTLVILAQRWAEAYMKKHPGTKVQVTGGGSGTGLAALINGTTDIAMASRHMKGAEQQQMRARYGTAGKEIAVARDGITFYVHESNPVQALTLEQLRLIYVGDLTRWEQVGGRPAPIIVYSRESSSGTYVFVKDELLAGEDFTAAAQTLPGTAAVVNAVSQEKNGVGYGGAAYGRRVRELQVLQGGERVAPSAENIRSGRYPLSRELYFYTRSEPSGELASFIAFALSAEGQALVNKVGYFPVK